MESNNLRPPPQPISFIRHNNPNQRFENITAGTTFPITISMYNATKLYFTITRNNVSIITSIDNEPNLHIIPTPHNNNFRVRRNNNNNDNNNNNNNRGTLHFLNDGEDLDFLNDFLNDEETLHFQNNGETLVLNLHHVPNIQNGNREGTFDFLGLISEFHGLTLRNLPTFPSYIHITSNNRTVALHVTANNTIDVNDQALSIPPPLNHDNVHVINKPVTIPFVLILLFNNPIDNTVVSIFVEFHNNNTVFIFANSEIGFLEWAAILDTMPEDSDDD